MMTITLNSQVNYSDYKADPEYGKGVAKALGIDINQIDLETNQDETYENFK